MFSRILKDESKTEYKTYPDKNIVILFEISFNNGDVNNKCKQ